MEKKKVGSKDCEYNELEKVFHQEDTATIVDQDWRKLARELKVPESEMAALKCQCKEDRLISILTSWRMRNSSEATLGKLTAHLQNLGWSSVIDSIQNAFQDSVNESTQLINADTEIKTTNVEVGDTSVTKPLARPIHCIVLVLLLASAILILVGFYILNSSNPPTQAMPTTTDKVLSSNTHLPNMQPREDMPSSTLQDGYASKSKFAFGDNTSIAITYLQSNSTTSLNFYDYDSAHVIPQSQATSTAGGSFVGNKLLRIFFLDIKIDSFDDYIRVMNTVPENKKVRLKIHLLTARDWPENSKMINAHAIEALAVSGSVKIEILFSILNQVHGIKNLHITNLGDSICSRNQNRRLSYLPEIELPNLHSLTLSRFSVCVEVLDAISRNIKMIRLRKFEYSKGIFSTKNAEEIRDIIHNCRSTLKYLNFTGTAMQTSFTTSSSQVNPLVTTVVVDILAPNISWSYFGSSFNRVFPMLRQLISNEGLLPGNQFLDIGTLEQLTYLQIGLNISFIHSDFGFQFLVKRFPLLEGANLTLIFRNCLPAHGDLIRLTEIDKLGPMFTTLTAKSNCKLSISCYTGMICDHIYKASEGGGPMYIFTVAWR